MASRVPLLGPRFIDPHIRNKIKPATRQRYKKCVSLFMSFCIRYKLHFAAVDELDDLLAEWKNTALPSKSEFEGAIAGIEHVLPGAKGGLPWSHSIVSAWGVCHEPEHTKPMTEGPAVYIGCQMSARGHGRLGAGVILQEALGLRPSELLGITGDDVMLPEDRAQEVFMPAVIGLGIKHGTKAKRAQTVMLASPIKVALLRWLKSRAPGAQPLVGYTYSGYRNVLKEIGRAHV